MKFKKLIFTLSCLLAIGMAFTSCSDNDDNDDEITTGVFILNEGNSGGNNAGITAYNPETGAMTSDVFYAQNNKGLGDTGQDMIEYGDKIYVTVYGSSLLVKLNKEGKELKSLSFSAADGQPRYMVAEDGKLYVTLYSGQVARIDTATLTIEAYAKVGANPEQIVEENGKLYVANSGWGSDNTVSVIDMSTFKEINKITVVVNPNDLIEANGEIFVISWGNFKKIPYTLQRINLQTAEVDSIAVATKMAEHDGIIYLVNSVTDWSVKPYVTQNTFFSYNVRKKQVNKDSFLKLEGDAAALASASVYMMTVDSNTGDIYVGTSNYSSNGDIYRFSKNGTLIKKFSSGGMNPKCAVFLQ